MHDAARWLVPVLCTLLLGVPPSARGETPDLILHGGTVVTMDSAGTVAEAIAVVGERILAVGTDAEILALQGPGTAAVDLAGATVLPGIVDAHTHLFNDAEPNMGMDLDEVQDLALQNGITTLGDMFVMPDFLTEMEALDREGRLRIRTSLYLLFNTNCGDLVGTWYLDHPPTRVPGEMLRIGGVKIFADGGTCGLPAFSFEYPDSMGMGDLWLEPAEMDATVATADSAGFPVVIHAVGDRAVETAQNAIELALGGRANALRHRIDHNTVVRPDLVPRYGEIGIVPILFGYTATCAENESGVWPYYVGEERLSWVRRGRTLLDGNPGTVFAWHGDDPWAGPIDPFLELYAMVTRREIDPDDGSVCLPPDWLAVEAITAPEALAMMTTGSARALFREEEVGHLAAGMFADMIVVPDDPLTVDPDLFPEIDVHLAMVGGEVGYCAPGPMPLCDAFRENLALGRPVTASASLPDHPPGAAVDGDLDSYWGAGDFAPQWIEIDLGGAFTVDNIQLVTDQFPGGDTRHIVYGKGPEPGAEYVPLHEFGRFTRTGEILGYSPPTPWEGIRYVRIETVESPSWVAWRDVEIVRWSSPPLAVGDGGAGTMVPRGMALAQNAPNPFNPSTTIAFEIPGEGEGRPAEAAGWRRVRIVVHDLRGRRVRTLLDEQRPTGGGRVTWDGRDDRGRQLPSGVYLYSLRVAGRTLTRKMTLLE